MLLSNSKKFIFIHVWKTAGTSIKNALNKFETNLNDKDNQLKHFKAKEIKEKFPTEFYQYFKFLFVRNPWDIQVSYYSYVLNNQTHFQHEHIKKFKDFTSYIEWRTNGNVTQQYEFCTDDKENIIVDFIGRYENLETDFYKIIIKLNLKNIFLQKLNSSSHSNYRHYFNQKSKDLISKYYEKDINYFKYKF